ncbi:MAG: gliding motility-associated C-terminal domain-containing protein [Bacteroidales bacterium]|jgi:gliding motility-associated-like protein|nr:gliding motility-associated C-terminal domain-containing protein [Bacteroidales bacterium]
MSKFQHIILFLGLFLPSLLKAELGSLPKSEPPLVQITTEYNVICRGNRPIFTAEVAESLKPVRCDWTINPSIDFFPLSDSSIFVNATDTGEFLITVFIYEANLGTPALLGSSEITIYVTTIPSVTPIHDTICLGNIATIWADTSASAWDLFYDWRPESDESTPFINVSPDETTDYTVLVSNYPFGEFEGVEYFNNCFRTDTATVVIDTNVKFYIIGDTIACVGDTIPFVTLTLVDGTVIAWFDEWFDEIGTADTIRIPIEEGDNKFYVEAIDDKGCQDTIPITVRGINIPNEVINDPGVDTICRGDSILLVASGGDRYEWNVFQNTDSIVVSPREKKFTYIVKAFTEHCYSVDSITIHTKNCDIVYFPSAISLSSPITANRIFKPIGEQQSFSQYHLAIYNRWGQLIFESRNFDIGWNGTHQGENVRPGTYVFVFRITNKGDVWEKVGTVTVID